jgi:hypothetical protein
MRGCLLYLWLLLSFRLTAAEQVDLADTVRTRALATGLAVRVRVTKVSPETETLEIHWRRGGEGLGGQVTRGQFRAAGKKEAPAAPLGDEIVTGKKAAAPSDTEVPAGAWTAWVPASEIAGRTRGWEFPTITVAPPASKKKAPPVTSCSVDFEVADKGTVIKAFSEASPKGATVGFAFPGGLLDDKGAVSPEFAAQLRGLSGHARARREMLEMLFPEPAPLPKQFGVIGHLAGYGEGAGYGIRHCNPEVVADECRCLRLLGVNGLVGRVGLADAAGFGDQFRRVYWGGPGSGSPMGALKAKDGGCPFDPAVKAAMAQSTTSAIAEHKAVGARESWALWWDEIGVAAKEHLADCPRCADQFREYLRALKLNPAAFGKAAWTEIAPLQIWKSTDPKLAPPAPSAPEEGLRYYYTSRFMTYATAQLFPVSAQQLKAAGIPLYAMQGPTPSWSGHSLDWHEFYDLGANTALVFETSNRDARVWQWESYLGDIMRGIAARHNLPLGCLIKPHRGAPQQRMLALVARGARVFEWYTYGPDYAKGDCFSQRPDLLEHVGRAGRFLGQGEEYLYGARYASQPEVAFVSPRSSEIWGKATALGVTAFEDAKWVYLALAHAHVPVDILSEQQLAEGTLEKYKALYVVGPNLHRAAAGKVRDWVHAGGLLWTDALGLSRDEANQPAEGLAAMLNPAGRALETWGSVEGYRAVGLTPLQEKDAPPHAALSWENPLLGKGQAQAAIGREPLAAADAETLATFADGKAAVVRRRFGQGEVVTCGFWAGLTYSAKVRGEEFDMRADFPSAVRNLVAAPAVARKVYRPVVTSEPLVEAVLLDKDGRRSVTLVNWAYARGGTGQRGAAMLQPAQSLRVSFHGIAPERVRSLKAGALTVTTEGGTRAVVVPKLEEIDLLVLE